MTFRKDSRDGAYELIRVTDERAGQKAKFESRLILTTDLAITYKRSSTDLLVWTTSLNSGAPKENVQIFAKDRNGNILALGKTDSSGVLTFSPKKVPGISIHFDNLKGFFKYDGPSGIIVTKVHNNLTVPEIETLLAVEDKDFSFLHLKQGEFHAKHVQFASSFEDTSSQQKAKIFTDRGIYRPGEKVYFKGAIRSFQDGQVLPPGGTTSLRVENSKGEEVFTSDQELSRFGTASGAMVIKPHFPLGTYNVYIKYLNYSASHSFKVEEFRAPRHFSRVSFSKKEGLLIRVFRNHKQYKYWIF